MSKDSSSLLSLITSWKKNTQEQYDGNENEFENLSNSIHFPPPRPPRNPLNMIPDPSQFHTEQQQQQQQQLHNKLELGSLAVAKSDKKTTESQLTLNRGTSIANVGSNYGTPPRVSAHRGKVQSEQITPARSVLRTSNIGGGGGGVLMGGGGGAACTTGHRPSHYSGPKGGSSSSSRASRGISIPKSEPLLLDVPLFELVEDSSFWKDHNVQVLIRIRPLSNSETVSQGHGWCLRQESPQTLVWLGHPETRFTFDHIACEIISQEKLFMVAGLPMVDNCMSGYNSCMFAYGQTGSGKTYTMMGEISQMDGKLSEDCGITPRIFEYLFTRITEEEENRRDERLKYSCKCSFLEIYNEQITDLLEPSSTNLQLREDLKKGVYVENLMEHSVGTVNDVIKLLLQGAANRKMAATHMNSESSRSHSVFTCIIESRWEKDSMTHLRFGRLNLVDLAGSERQKSSGAEGDRLKEAANINKSLSTLGLVIMSLVDLAHGKHRHVPYRDSRLTFLLQDSLGGNSKTTIIANVSPSICSANETLSTLKFAQRAKLIQNNAKVNEDASGDVTSLQRQIQQLKGQLSFLMKHNDNPRSLSCLVPSFQQSSLNDFPEEDDSSLARNMYDDDNIQSFRRRKLKCRDATLVGALRREKLAETAVKRSEAEIEQMCRLAQQREEDAQRTKMTLRFREEKIKRLELFVDGLVSADKYLMEENNTLTEEIQLLRARIDRNPELTRFALENIRLLEQLRLFQDFYEQGERETLFAEISDLRDQLLEMLDGNYEQHISPSRTQKQDDDDAKELGDCRNMNSKLIREVDELKRELNKYMNINQAAFSSITDSLTKDPEEFKQTDKYSLVEALSIRCDSVDEMASDNQPEDEFLQNKIEKKMANPLAMQSTSNQKELGDARLLIEALESERVRLMEELQFMREENQRYMKILSEKGKVDGQFELKFESHCIETGDLGNQNQTSAREGSKDISIMALQAKLDRMTNELEEARLLKFKYQMDQASQLTQDHQIELVREQVEMETAKTIIHLQDEVDTLQSEFQDKLCYMAEENVKLRNTIAAKEDETKALTLEWERATSDLTSFLLDGSKSLKDASGHIETIASSFPRVNVWISEHVERIGKLCFEKEEMILMLQKSLEDAQKVILEMELKLDSLKGATMALTEVQQLEKDASTKASSQLTTLLNDKVNMIQLLEHKLKYKEDQIKEAEKRANAAFLVVKRLTESSKAAFRKNDVEDVMSKMATSSELGTPQISGAAPHESASVLEDIEIQVELATLGLLETENAINASCTETYTYLFAVETEIHKASSLSRELIQGLLKDMQEMRRNLVDLKENQKDSQLHRIRTPSLLAHKFSKHENQCYMLHQIRDELAETNYKLDIVKGLLRTYGCPVTAENLGDEDGCSASYATSGSNLSAETIDPEDIFDGSSSSCCCERPGAFDLEGGSVFPSHNHESEKPERLLRKSIRREATLCLRKEFKMANDTLSKLNVLLAGLFNENNIEDCSYIEGACLPKSLAFLNDGEQNIPNNGFSQLKLPTMTPVLQPLEQELEAGHDKRELISRENINQGSCFFSKFEEARATMKEADFMLNALLRANEDEKQLTSVWRRAGEELVVEKTNLMKEIRQLRSSIHLKDGENALLHDEIHHSLLEIGNLMSLVEGSFLHMQRDVEQMFRILYSDASAMVQDILHSIYNTKSLLEDICSDTMEKEFTSFVLYQCHVGESPRKIPSLDEDSGSPQSRLQASYFEIQNRRRSWFIGENDTVVSSGESKWEGNQTSAVAKLEGQELVVTHENLGIENLSLKKELEWKEHLLKGLLFDFSLLQESASSTKDIRDETDKLLVVLSQVRHELEMKTGQLNDILVQHRELEGRLVDDETALSISNSDLEDANGTLNILSDQNTELRVLLKDLYLKKSEAEEELEEQTEIVKSLEKEILRLTSCADAEKKLLSSIEDIEEELRRVNNERDQLREQVGSLQDRLDLAYALADENEAIAVEARQESEASKQHAEQKEQEVKILEHSVEELDCTINVLEKKVYEMEEDVERHKLIRDSLELELQELRHRILTLENFTESTNVEQHSPDQLLRQLHNRSMELHEAHKRMEILEEERAEQAKEIKQCKEYISELVLLAEAQASQYQQKYKTLEAMARDVKVDSSTLTSAAAVLDKGDKSYVRTRGSSSPFRCIASLVQQMNTEKDQELSMARLRIEELEALAASRKKELCVLNARLAAAESMTHDVIRDLLGVKLDMTNYAKLIDQYQLQKLVEAAQQKTQESISMEQEILNQRREINYLIEERERCMSDVNRREVDILAVQMTVEQLQGRDQLLTAQNEMLKKEKTNLKRRIAELDEMVRKLLGTENAQLHIQQHTKTKGNSSVRQGEADLSKRLANSEKLLWRVNDELAHYYNYEGSHALDKMDRHVHRK